MVKVVEVAGMEGGGDDGGEFREDGGLRWR